MHPYASLRTSSSYIRVYIEIRNIMFAKELNYNTDEEKLQKHYTGWTWLLCLTLKWCTYFQKGWGKCQEFRIDKKGGVPCCAPMEINDHPTLVDQSILIGLTSLKRYCNKWYYCPISWSTGCRCLLVLRLNGACPNLENESSIPVIFFAANSPPCTVATLYTWNLCLEN